MTPRPFPSPDPRAPAPSVAFGGPCDGAILRSHFPRLWVARVSGDPVERLLDGDESFGAFLYDIIRLQPTVSPLAIIRGCYHRADGGDDRLHYLDLLIGEGTEGQRKFFDLSLFLPYAVMLLRSNDWHTRRPDAEFAERVLTRWQHDPSVAALCTKYLGMLLLDDLGEW